MYWIKKEKKNVLYSAYPQQTIKLQYHSEPHNVQWMLSVHWNTNMVFTLPLSYGLFNFKALPLLDEWQQGHPACKNVLQLSEKVIFYRTQHKLD